MFIIMYDQILASLCSLPLPVTIAQHSRKHKEATMGPVAYMYITWDISNMLHGCCKSHSQFEAKKILLNEMWNCKNIAVSPW